MTYYQFVQAVEGRIKEAVKESVAVRIHTAEKNNGTIRRGLTLTEQDINISPTIYLEEYYRQFQNGGSLDHITSDILRLYNEVRFQKSWGEEKLYDYSQVKEKVIYRLVNYESNEKMLRNVPYIVYLDLAIVFCVLLEVTKYGTATMAIRNDHLDLWGVEKEELYRQASENTSKFLPDDFSSMSAVIEELTEESEAHISFEDKEEEMYVLSNRIHSYGAAAILYSGRMEGIGMYLKSNYYVLPSSVHEVIVVPEKAAVEKEDLSAMVAEINRTQVEAEEVLSDHAYYYDRKKGRLFM
ncbi:hypothetical protein C818_00116 [Lachnospiraceae bacterium MD308]|nr:hypothetical protein C818_00116 [Lachnospiraceae bacterium MD308]